MTNRPSRGERELLIYQLQGLREWPDAELCESFGLSPAGLKRLVRRFEARTGVTGTKSLARQSISRDCTGSQRPPVDPSQLYPCLGCWSPIERGRGRVPKLFCAACLRINRGLAELERGLRGARFPDSPEGRQAGAALAARLFWLRNLYLPIARHAERGPGARFVTRRTP